MFGHLRDLINKLNKDHPYDIYYERNLMPMRLLQILERDSNKPLEKWIDEVEKNLWKNI